MIAENIKMLRETKGITQTTLAKHLGITRSSVNAWELGISVPSTQFIVELSNFFKVSSDYLLGIKKTSSISVDGLSEKDLDLVYKLVEHLRNRPE